MGREVVRYGEGGWSDMGREVVKYGEGEGQIKGGRGSDMGRERVR